MLVVLVCLSCSVELGAAQDQATADFSGRRIIASTRLLPAAVPQSDPSGAAAPQLLASAPRLAGASPQEQTPSSVPGQAGTTPPAAAQPGAGNQRFLELRSFTNLSRVTGVARNRSFLTAGRNSAVDLSYLENFGVGMRRFEAVSVLRYADDPRVDPEHSSVQRAYFRINGPRSEYNFGDYLVSYSRFSYNQNLKGLHFIRSAPWGAGFRLLGNAGTFTDRYGSLFKDELPGKPFTRVVSGVRAEQRITADKLFAFNWAYGNDIVRSIPVDPATGREPFVPVANNVVSLDTRMLFARIWNLEGELAYSITNPDTRFSSAQRKDYALRIDNTVRQGAWTASVYYTRIMPSFLAVNARQVADLQDVLFRANVALSSKVAAQFAYRRTNDDLREQRVNPATVFQMPEFRISFRDLPGMGSTLIDAGYRERRQGQGRLADRLTRTPFFEIAIPISSTVLTLGFEHRSNVDRLNPSNQTSTNDASISYRGIFNVGDWSVNPMLRYEHNREVFDRVVTSNNTRTLQTALVLDAPRYFTFEAMFRQMGATLFRDRPVLDPVTLRPTGFEVAGPSGFRRPALRLAVTYKLRNDENRFVTFSYERNNNLFALAGQDFLERVMQVTVVWRFRRQ
ncbi:MAG: hypothetical protein A3H28_08865 [Acidobacteria bacterium RIFCSPLOWO2_02_FULL_61_28]|nr:MAG: hypothetical protein A3H28_08865 [Acidobacteria bacterium RIFCSPLOWO2_02_FULL_61_28]